MLYPSPAPLPGFTYVDMQEKEGNASRVAAALKSQVLELASSAHDNSGTNSTMQAILVLDNAEDALSSSTSSAALRAILNLVSVRRVLHHCR